MTKSFWSVVSSATVVLALTSSQPVRAQLTSAQGNCLVQMNRRLFKIDRVQGKIIQRCVKSFSYGKPLSTDPQVETLEECLFADYKGKRATEEGKTTATFNKACNGNDSNQQPKLAPFGVTDDEVVIAAAIQKQVDLVHDVFGPDLDASGTIATGGSEAIKCQLKVLRAVHKCESLKLKVWYKCKKGAAGSGVSNAAELETLCMMQDGDPTTGLPDPGDKIAKYCSNLESGLGREVQRRCVEEVNIPTLSELFAPCGTNDAAQLTACLDQAVECRVCKAINTADALTRDCDLFDNGVDDGSCD